MDGKELKRIIKQSGRSQKELAEQMGMQPSQWTAYFRQESVSSEVLERVASLLGMSMGQLYGEATAAAEHNRNQQIREMSVAAMQGLIASNPVFTESAIKEKGAEKLIAEMSVRQAQAMMAEFQKAGIDK